LYTFPFFVRSFVMDEMNEKNHYKKLINN
jgi:hypothetical protein